MTSLTRIVFLDRETLSDSVQLQQVPFKHELQVYGRTAPEQVAERIADADIVIYDPNGHTSIGYGPGKKHHMNMDHSAWEGFEIDGHVDTVLSRGKVVIDDNNYLGAKGDGRFVKRATADHARNASYCES